MIDSKPKLEEFLSRVAGAEWAAIDTEADSLHAYPEKLCLLQLSIEGTEELVDPLAGFSLEPLLFDLQRHELILHGADYDLRLLYRTFHFVPSSMFDTMWAARLLGEKQFGLTDLVANHLEVKLEKGPQKMNWARRPLTPRMETYARNDIHYLKPLEELLRSRLEQKERLEWHRQICAQLIKDCATPRALDPDGVWRMKGSDRLNPAGLSVLRDLWHWREQEAIRANRPPFFVLSHEQLVAMAAALAQDQPLASVVPHQVQDRRRARLVEAIERSLQAGPESYPRPRRFIARRLDRDEQERFESLRQRRDRVAVELEIDPTLIASKATLLRVAQCPGAESTELLPWQQGLLLEASSVGG